MTNYTTTRFFSNRFAAKEIQTVGTFPVLKLRGKIQIENMANHGCHLIIKSDGLNHRIYLKLNALTQKFSIKIVDGQLSPTSVMLAF